MLDLNLRVFGDVGRPVVVLLHGLFGSAANWGAVARHLQSSYRVLVPDLRNHGQSPHHPEHSYEAMVADLLRLLDANAVAEATLIGHSMGGKVAMQLALGHPARVGRLAVVDMSPVRYTHNFAAVLQAFRAVDLDSLASRAEADAQMAGVVAASGVRAFLLQNLVKTDRGWTWRANLDALDAAQAQITGFPDQPAGACYTGPAAFIYGEQSDYVAPAHLPRIREFFPNARMYPIAQAGHWVYADQPQRFLATLDAFLDGRAGS